MSIKEYFKLEKQYFLKHILRFVLHITKGIFRNYLTYAMTREIDDSFKVLSFCSVVRMTRYSMVGVNV